MSVTLHHTKYLPWLTLAVVILLASIISLMVGVADLSLPDVIQTVMHGGDYDFVINHYRLPRLFLAIGVGAGLGLSGALVQGVIRNPLASPDLIGISAGAGFVATLVLTIYPNAPLYVLPIAAVIGGIATGISLLVITHYAHLTPARMALVGIAISAFLASGIDYLLVVHPIEINTAMVWLTGSLWGRDWEQVPYIWMTLALLLPVTLWLAWRLDVVGLGDDTAISLGVDLNKVQGIALLCAIVLASISVAIAGTISFVGLLAPHLARLIFGHHHKALLVGSSLIGALLVLTADTIARGIQPPIELPAGVLTSIIGAPYFIFLLQRYKGW
ncbi:iron chelate uptake ABC transporter family permease subunit [Vibrio sp. ZSDZ65]|uniref:Iron chelate uptake ABC transporter family permease subunit n=1 Tax=Vibrio qingdaonensis TaxID=2829491 RepID=A0A9X3CMC9_9VIBR|nr:iron chelate uptake ABC transporter family permease subunit [Vibrio qingdaonensis]MCW8345789.1 iron chelate uptake ABC transporter family permease subunit [Vibrio qingdaonensis]